MLVPRFQKLFFQSPPQKHSLMLNNPHESGQAGGIPSDRGLWYRILFDNISLCGGVWREGMTIG